MSLTLKSFAAKADSILENPRVSSPYTHQLLEAIENLNLKYSSFWDSSSGKAALWEKLASLAVSYLANILKVSEQEVVERAKSMVVCKFHDYGPKPLLKFRDRGCLVRATDKVYRLENLTCRVGKPEVDEKIEDTVLDLLCYSIWAMVLAEESTCAD